MTTLQDRIYHTLYATNHPQRTRTQPMQVIAVGISRSATESLQQALHVLGVSHVWHGWDAVFKQYSLEEWYKLAVKKYHSPPNESSIATGLKVTREDFDVIIGDCVGISDLPAAAFARELIAAYPEAKVILNTRSDMVAWQRSFRMTFGMYDQNPKNWDWCKSWFCAELFWARQYTSRTQLPGFFVGSFASNGVWRYQEHVAMVRGLGLPPDRLLEWQVADGWAPLCEFLGKPVPSDIDFPQGNLPAAWTERLGGIMREHDRRALRNMSIFVALLVTFFSWVAYVGSRV